jgi:hypothetical protein
MGFKQLCPGIPQELRSGTPNVAKLFKSSKAFLTTLRKGLNSKERAKWGSRTAS